MEPVIVATLSRVIITQFTRVHSSSAMALFFPLIIIKSYKNLQTSVAAMGLFVSLISSRLARGMLELGIHHAKCPLAESGSWENRL